MIDALDLICTALKLAWEVVHDWWKAYRKLTSNPMPSWWDWCDEFAEIERKQ